MRFLGVVLFLAVLMVFLLCDGDSEKLDDFLEERYRIIKAEKMLSLGGNIKLNSKESKANQIILNVKKEELEIAYQNESEFLPSQHFFQARPEIEKSKVFAIIEKIPKGCSLHIHLLADVRQILLYQIIPTKKCIRLFFFINDTFKLKLLKDKSKDVIGENWKIIEVKIIINPR